MKRITGIFLILCMVISLTACGASTNPPQVSSSQSAAPAPAADKAVEEEVVEIEVNIENLKTLTQIVTFTLGVDRFDDFSNFERKLNNNPNFEQEELFGSLLTLFHDGYIPGEPAYELDPYAGYSVPVENVKKYSVRLFGVDVTGFEAAKSIEADDMPGHYQPLGSGARYDRIIINGFTVKQLSGGIIECSYLLNFLDTYSQKPSYRGARTAIFQHQTDSEGEFFRLVDYIEDSSDYLSHIEHTGESDTVTPYWGEGLLGIVTETRLQSAAELSMRKGPGPDYSIIKTIPANEYMDEAGYSRDVQDWIYVYYDEDYGWINRQDTVPGQSGGSSTAPDANASATDWAKIYHDYIKAEFSINEYSSYFEKVNWWAHDNKTRPVRFVWFCKVNGYEYPVMIFSESLLEQDNYTISMESQMRPTPYSIQNGKIVRLPQQEADAFVVWPRDSSYPTIQGEELLRLDLGINESESKMKQTMQQLLLWLQGQTIVT